MKDKVRGTMNVSDHRDDCFSDILSSRLVIAKGNDLARRLHIRKLNLQ